MSTQIKFKLQHLLFAVLILGGLTLFYGEVFATHGGASHGSVSCSPNCSAEVVHDDGSSVTVHITWPTHSGGGGGFSDGDSCGGANCGSSDDDRGTLTCPPGTQLTRSGTCVSTEPPTATISQSKTSTLTGESFTVTYGHSGGGEATSCTLQRQYSNVTTNGGGVSNFNDNIGTPGNYNYRAQCYGPAGSSSWVSLDHTVYVPPPTVSLSADQYVVPFNTATTLRWTSTNANSCTASGVWGGSKATAGSDTSGNLKALSTFFLQCHNSYGQSTSPAAVNINIRYGTGSEIDVTPKVVRKNTPVTVTWNTGTSVPANCQIQTGSTVLRSPLTTTTGSFTHTVTGETTFTINCEDGHNTADGTVKVLPEFQET